MATEILQMDYHYVILDDEPSAAAAALAVLWGEGVNLVGFSEFPHGPGKTQLDLIAPDSRSPRTRIQLSEMWTSNTSAARFRVLLGNCGKAWIAWRESCAP